MSCLLSWFTFVLLLFFLSPVATAQKKENETREIEFAKELKFNFSDTYHKKVLLPFKNIIVWDYRYDSSKIGYISQGLGKSRFKKIQLDSGWNYYLNNYFNKNLEKESEYSLLIIIRNFWMQQGIIDELTDKKIIKKDFWGPYDFYGRCKADLDIFIRKDTTLYAIFKIEDLFLGPKYFNSLYLKDWIKLPFDSFARRIENYDFSLLETKRKYTADEVSSYYQKRFELPVLKGTSINKGIFKTFDDFKNNKPVEMEYKLVKGKKTDELYIIENGSEKIVSEFLGVYDGNVLFIRSAFNVFPAVKQQNSFEVFGAMHLSRVVERTRVERNIYSQDYIELQRSILQVNMENGIFY